MFTGIVESKQKITQILVNDQSLRISIAKPEFFNDLKIGDSIAVDGVCLTVEAFDRDLVFTIGYETLKVMKWNPQNLSGKYVNLERSLRFGDRIHGHLVSGHADGTIDLVKRVHAGDSLILDFRLPPQYEQYFWKKGSITLNGVSLTVNDIDASTFSVCLIPETWKKTNLESIKVGDSVSFECDYFMKGFLNAKKYEGTPIES